MGRAAVVGVVAAAAVAGLMFAPVFGFRALVVPVGVVCLLVHGVFELCRWRPGLVAWRPLIAGLVGVVGVFLATVGVPTAASVRGFWAGVAGSWEAALQSTWPVRPEPEVLLFVPVGVLLAAVLGVELLRVPLLALAPGLGLLVLSQAYVAVGGVVSVVVGVGYAVLVGVVLVASSPTGWRWSRVLVPIAVVAVVGAVVGVLVDPVGREPVSLRDSRPVQPPRSVVNPLQEVAGQLRDADRPVFSYTTDAPVDRWRVAVFDSFDGAAWSTSGGFRVFGARLDPAVPGRTEVRTARVHLDGDQDGLLPSQALPVAVTGLTPLVDERTGMLLAAGPAPADYDLSWVDPVPADDLATRAIDPDAARDLGRVTIPPGVVEQATRAVDSADVSLQTALVLEQYFRRNDFRRAEGADLPTGSGWPQLRQFLTDRRGTSEQFAAAYVLLARSLGIPARLAVGYRAPAPSRGRPVTVHGGDVLAWPEVAVAGVGWIPVDPSSSLGVSTSDGGLAAATERARAELPSVEQRRDQERAPVESAAPAPGGFPWWLLAAVVLLLVLALPVLRVFRALRRRRSGVAGAWSAARAVVRAYGVAVEPGMTVRDLARAAGPVTDGSVAAGLAELAAVVDGALWSGRGESEEDRARAWAAVGSVRRGLRRAAPRGRVAAWVRRG